MLRMTHSAPNHRLHAGDTFVTVKHNLSVSQLLLEYLKLEGATKLFGIPGGALIYLLNDLRLQRDDFDFYICRQETGAAYIAHGYAVVSGQLGVVLTTAGPASTNALTGLMNAQSSNCSLLHISGEVPQVYFGQGYLQEGIDAKLDVEAIYRNAVEYTAVISSQKNFATLFQQSLRDARSQPPRAAHISLPNDVAAQCVTGDDLDDPYRIPFPRSPDNYRTIPRGTDAAAAGQAFDTLAAATRPLIFLGNGARQALACPQRYAAFTTMVERFGLPVMTTPDAKGIFPETHAWSLRNYGMAACAWPDRYIADDDYDAVLVLGSALGELATSVVARDHYSKHLIPSSHFMQVDLDQSVIGRDFPITLGLVGDVGASLDVMHARADATQPDPSRIAERARIIGDIKRTQPFADPLGRASTAAPLHPAALVRVINETIASGHIFIDAGNCVGWSLNNLVVDPSLAYHSALDMGPMGFAVGAVIGAKIAAPDAICLALVGDGAFLMHGSEISTAAQSGIGAIWVVLDDNDLAMVSQGMGGLFPPPCDWADYYALGRPDLVRFAQGLGADAVAVTNEQGPEDFRTALTAAIDAAAERHRPQVIVAQIDTRPMPPYGWPPVNKPSCVHKPSCKA
jgi:acetolactate synthase-1/2/3 large subunit